MYVTVIGNLLYYEVSLWASVIAAVQYKQL